MQTCTQKDLGKSQNAANHFPLCFYGKLFREAFSINYSCCLFSFVIFTAGCLFNFAFYFGMVLVHLNDAVHRALYSFGNYWGWKWMKLKTGGIAFINLCYKKYEVMFVLSFPKHNPPVSGHIIIHARWYSSEGHKWICFLSTRINLYASLKNITFSSLLASKKFIK